MKYEGEGRNTIPWASWAHASNASRPCVTEISKLVNALIQARHTCKQVEETNDATTQLISSDETVEKMEDGAEQGYKNSVMSWWGKVSNRWRARATAN
jgi:hypothetical protein